MFKQFSITILMAFLTISLVNAQKSNDNDCQVLHPKLDSVYNGECKKGLAHGEGVAMGEAKYEGKFKKGLPHGKGKLIANDGKYIYEGRWKKGKQHGRGKLIIKRENLKDSIVKGRWRKGELVKNENEKPPYRFSSGSGITRVNFIQNSPNGNQIVIRFKRNGKYANIQTSNITKSSGFTVSNSYPLRIENVVFPFDCRIIFSASNLLGSSSNTYRLNFEITEPGYWEVTVNY
jgi:hypothetical protein